MLIHLSVILHKVLTESLTSDQSVRSVKVTQVTIKVLGVVSPKTTFAFVQVKLIS